MSSVVRPVRLSLDILSLDKVSEALANTLTSSKEGFPEKFIHWTSPWDLFQIFCSSVIHGRFELAGVIIANFITAYLNSHLIDHDS